MRSQAPIFANRLSYAPGRVVVLQAGRGEVQLDLAHANIWAQMPGYFFDGEWTEVSLRYGLGLPHGVELLAILRAYGRSGGFLDGFISGFHQTFGITQARRNLYGRNRLRVQTIASGTATPQLGAGDAGIGVGNPAVGVRKRLGAFVGEFVLKLPLGSIARQFATANVAALLDVAAQIPIARRVTLYVASGIVYAPGLQRVYGMELSWLQKFFFAGVGVAVAAPLRLVLQYLNQDGVVERAAYAPLNSTTHEFLLAAQLQLGARLMGEVGLIENSIHDANTPDFGLHLGLRLRL